METPTRYQPRVEREGRIEMRCPHARKEIAFAHPSAGPSSYRSAGRQILDAGQRVPTGDEMTSLLYSAYCGRAREEPEFLEVRKTMCNRGFWIFNRNLWTPEGVYVIQDTEAIGTSQPLQLVDLEKKLEGGFEDGCIRCSRDGALRFVPKEFLGNAKRRWAAKENPLLFGVIERVGGVYHQFLEPFTYGNYSLFPKEFAEDAFVRASFGKRGAEKLGKIIRAGGDFPKPAYFPDFNNGRIHLSTVTEGQKQTISLIRAGIRLEFYSCDFSIGGEKVVAEAPGVWE